MATVILVSLCTERQVFVGGCMCLYMFVIAIIDWQAHQQNTLQEGQRESVNIQQDQE